MRHLFEILVQITSNDVANADIQMNPFKIAKVPESLWRHCVHIIENCCGSLDHFIIWKLVLGTMGPILSQLSSCAGAECCKGMSVKSSGVNASTSSSGHTVPGAREAFWATVRSLGVGGILW